MKIFFIGDTHFFHENIIQYCGRPENHEDLIIERWNSVVSDEDVVFHLGDIAAGIGDKTKDLINVFKELKGRKILIAGNHDKKHPNWYKRYLGFDSVYEWTVLGDYFLTHYPLETNEYMDEKEKERIKKLEKHFLESDASFVIHGHTHNRNTKMENHFNVSVEVLDYTPISLQELELRFP